MKHPREIIIAPLLTEKTQRSSTTDNSYTFKVSVNANKIEIKQAIEHVFGVSVLKVNTINQRGKTKRLGRYVGRRSDWKKAIVKLRAGDKIAEFDV
ncbi:MAG: 50S ribosomal protein L23 [Candidatus Cloacimonetes bacterium]|nr:50S ribosomal protein L23 [Candidatus Cloacimonadota bacterium]